MWAIGVSSNASEVEFFGSKIEFQQKKKLSEFSNFHSVEIEESEFVIIESEPELEVNLDWILITSRTFRFNEFSNKENKCSQYSPLFSSKETIPLYDLYCNWKVHLS